MMNKDEQERQEKLLSRLAWMNERSQRDFKGNPPPFEQSKTMQSVEKERRNARRALVGDEDFRPFWHTPVPLAEDATRADYLAGLNNDTFEKNKAKVTLRGAQQRIDPATGLPEIQAALCWDAPVRPQSRLPAEESIRLSHDNTKDDDSSTTKRKKAGYRLHHSHASTLGPQERTAAYREEIMSHPMFTRESADAHGERWRSGTQLTGPMIAPPKRRNGGHTVGRRNPVRMVVYERTQ